MRRSLMVLLVVNALAGCSGATGIKNDEILTGIDNTNRVAIAATVSSATHLCVEPVGAATKLNDTKATAAATFSAAASASLSFENAQTLGQIYSVGDIMQFAQSSLFRLCEAVSNGDIKQADYGKYYAATMLSTATLLCVQSQSTAAGAAAKAQQDSQTKKEQASQAQTKAAAAASDADTAETQLKNTPGLPKPAADLLYTSKVTGNHQLLLDALPANMATLGRTVVEKRMKADAAKKESDNAAADAAKADKSAQAAEDVLRTSCAGAMTGTTKLLQCLSTKDTTGCANLVDGAAPPAGGPLKGQP